MSDRLRHAARQRDEDAGRALRLRRAQALPRDTAGLERGDVGALRRTRAHRARPAGSAWRAWRRDGTRHRLRGAGPRPGAGAAAGQYSARCATAVARGGIAKRSRPACCRRSAEGSPAPGVGACRAGFAAWRCDHDHGVARWRGLAAHRPQGARAAWRQCGPAGRQRAPARWHGRPFADGARTRRAS